MTINSDAEIDRILSYIESFAKSHCIGLDNFKAGSISNVPFLFIYEGRTYSSNDKGEWNNFVELASEVVPAGTSTLTCDTHSTEAECEVTTCRIYTAGSSVCTFIAGGDSAVNLHTHFDSVTCSADESVSQIKLTM